MMKLFGTLFPALSSEQLVKQICLAHWLYERGEEHEFVVSAEGVKISVEGSGEVLLFGELSLTLEEIDSWIAVLSALPISYNIDIHADEARLIRRYQQ